MGYVDKILGDKERVIITTHQHLIVLLLRAGIPFLITVVFVVLGVVALAGNDAQRQVTGQVALATVLWPVGVMLTAFVRGARGRELLQAIWRPVLMAAAIMLVASILLSVPEEDSPLLIAVGIASLLAALIPGGNVVQTALDWYNEKYLITNRRVMEVKGIINKHVRDSALEKVNDVDMTQTILGRLLGYGTVQIITGSDIGLNRFQRISNPVRFKREMLNQKEALGHLDGYPPQAAPAGATDTTALGDIPALIAELDELRRKGIISDAEFERKKQQLLDKIK